MEEIALVLDNARPQDTGEVYEHLFPEKGPRWRFAIFREGWTSDSILPANDGAVSIAATAIGPRKGGVATGPVVLWLVLTNPAPGKEAAYNEWYDGRHVADTLAIPGFLSARRYKVTSIDGPADARWSYLALYEIEADRAAESLAEAAARAGGPKMPNPGMLAPGTAALPLRAPSEIR